MTAARVMRWGNWDASSDEAAPVDPLTPELRAAADAWIADPDRAIDAALSRVVHDELSTQINAAAKYAHGLDTLLRGLVQACTRAHDGTPLAEPFGLAGAYASAYRAATYAAQADLAREVQAILDEVKGG